MPHNTQWIAIQRQWQQYDRWENVDVDFVFVFNQIAYSMQNIIKLFLTEYLLAYTLGHFFHAWSNDAMRKICAINVKTLMHVRSECVSKICWFAVLWIDRERSERTSIWRLNSSENKRRMNKSEIIHKNRCKNRFGKHWMNNHFRSTFSQWFVFGRNRQHNTITTLWCTEFEYICTRLLFAAFHSQHTREKRERCGRSLNNIKACTFHCIRPLIYSMLLYSRPFFFFFGMLS